MEDLADIWNVTDLLSDAPGQLSKGLAWTRGEKLIAFPVSSANAL
jgi:hypothetical protein